MKYTLEEVRLHATKLRFAQRVISQFEDYTGEVEVDVPVDLLHYALLIRNGIGPIPPTSQIIVDVLVSGYRLGARPFVLRTWHNAKILNKEYKFQLIKSVAKFCPMVELQLVCTFLGLNGILVVHWKRNLNSKKFKVKITKLLNRRSVCHYN